MAEEATDSASAVKVSSSDGNVNSVDATIQSGIAGGAGENSVSVDPESSLENSAGEREKSLEYADELMAVGSKAAEERDYAEASDCYSRALEIRVTHFGELSPQCASAYYKYGCALLYKAQDEADPFVSMPKKDGVSEEDSNRDSSVSAVVTGESSSASASVSEKGNCSKSAGSVEVNAEEGEAESDDEVLADGDEDESDLDLAWKMLDVARAIVEKHSGDTMEKVDILSALAEVSLEREDVETSLADYLKALSILERLVEPDSRHIAELNFRLCLCLEIGAKPEEAVPYCQKAISVCKSRVQRLTEEVKNSSEISETSIDKKSEALGPGSCSSSSLPDNSVSDKRAEIETLNGLCSELEKKLEDLEQLISNPKSILADILGIMSSAKAKEAEKNAVSTAAAAASQIAATAGASGSSNSTSTNGTSGVTHLGVVGRGVKRIAVAPTSDAASPSKRTWSNPEDDRNES